MDKQYLEITSSSNKERKDWEDSIISTSKSMSPESDPFYREMRLFFPYFFILDEKKGNIAFINREYEFLPQRISINKETEVKWYKIQISNEFKEYFPESEFSMNVDGTDYHSHVLYLDNTNPYYFEFNLINYIQELNYIDEHLLCHSPFIHRLLMSISESYLLLSENLKLKKENARLEESRKSLMKI